jgi:putative SOS response-associated peptidase YedK
MCGRYALFSPGERIAALFGVTAIVAGPGSLRARYNIAPGQSVLIVRSRADGTRELAPAIWGFGARPHDAAEGREPQRSAPVNARAESAASLPMFGDAFRHRRCLVPADAFYEWKVVGVGGGARPERRPMAIRRPDGGLLALAGLWDWSHGSESVAVLTTAPNALLATIHDRMPVIVPERDWDAWLDPDNTDAGALQRLIARPAELELNAFAVSRRVNDPSHDDAACLAPVEADGATGEGSLFG